MKRSTRKIFLDYGGTILAALLAAFIIRTYFIEAYRIPSFGMKPTLISGDTIFVAKWSYYLRKSPIPERGDVVVFSTTGNSKNSSLDLIKRVVGLPGDKIAVEKGHLILNGRSLVNNPQRSEKFQTEIQPNGARYQICLFSPVMEDSKSELVPEGFALVVGDMRSRFDSKKRKNLELVPLSSLKGKAIWIWLSIDPNPESREGASRFPHFRWERMFRRIE